MFFTIHKGQLYLVTNWHVVSGRDADIKLYDLNGNKLWYEMKLDTFQFGKKEV